MPDHANAHANAVSTISMQDVRRRQVTSIQSNSKKPPPIKPMAEIPETSAQAPVKDGPIDETREITERSLMRNVNILDRLEYLHSPMKGEYYTNIEDIMTRFDAGDSKGARLQSLKISIAGTMALIPIVENSARDHGTNADIRMFNELARQSEDLFEKLEELESSSDLENRIIKEVIEPYYKNLGHHFLNHLQGIYDTLEDRMTPEEMEKFKLNTTFAKKNKELGKYLDKSLDGARQKVIEVIADEKGG